MRHEFKLPDIGEGLTEAEIVEWRVKEGDLIKEDDPLLDLQTDKAIVEITSPHTGKILSVAGKKGEVFPVGSVLVVFDVEGEDGADATTGAVCETNRAPAPGIFDTAPPPSSPIGSSEPVKASPHTRKLAREAGIDLSRVPPTGPKGRTLKSDVESFAASTNVTTANSPSAFAHPVKAVPIPQVGEQIRIPLKGLRRAIAESMVRSVTIIPHATSFFRCNGETFLTLRKALQESYGARISFTAMMMKAMVPALKKYPNFNASVDDEASEIVQHQDINIGFAAHTKEGVIVPVVKNVPGKTVAEVSSEIDRLASLARERKIGIEDLRGATITLSNVGSHGRADTMGGQPIINHPQSAIIVMSKITPRAVIKNGLVVPQQCLDVGTSYDHRIIDGIYAALFMDRLIEIIEEPGLLLGL